MAEIDRVAQLRGATTALAVALSAGSARPWVTDKDNRILAAPAGTKPYDKDAVQAWGDGDPAGVGDPTVTAKLVVETDSGHYPPRAVDALLICAAVNAADVCVPALQRLLGAPKDFEVAANIPPLTTRDKLLLCAYREWLVTGQFGGL